MINGIGVVGWGVGGIEAEAAMLGQPVYFLTPDVVGVKLTGQLREGVTATDLVLTGDRDAAPHKVVGKFVEFFGEGTAPWRCPTAPPSPTWRPNTAPPWASSRSTKRPSTTSRAPAAPRPRSKPSRPTSRRRACSACRCAGEIDYSAGGARPGHVDAQLAGPKRPQDRIELPAMSATVRRPVQPRRPTRRERLRPPGAPRSTHALRHRAASDVDLGHGDVLIAAITSCTNTSNPSVLLAAGLLAKKAVARACA
jgi:aconitate hydratase